MHSPRPNLHFQWASGTCYRAATVRERSVRQKAEYRSALPRQSPSSTRPARSLSSKDNPGVWKGIPSGISDPCDLRGRGTMDVLRMLAELRGERARLAEAIVSLEKLALLSKPRRGRPPESSRAARCHSASDPECPQRLNGWGRLVRASRLTTLSRRCAKDPRRKNRCIRTQPLAHGVPSGPGSALRILTEPGPEGTP